MWEVGSGINVSSLRSDKLISNPAYFFNHGGLLLVQAIHVSSFIIGTTTQVQRETHSVSHRICWRESESSTQRCKVFTKGDRSEEHTSELQSHSDLVCRLLLEKKKKKKNTKNYK